MYRTEIMLTRGGNKSKDQKILHDTDGSMLFVSYGTNIAYKGMASNWWPVLDEEYWDYSRTTLKYLSEFTKMSTLDIKCHIKLGNITLVNLRSIQLPDIKPLHSANPCVEVLMPFYWNAGHHHQPLQEYDNED